MDYGSVKSKMQQVKWFEGVFVYEGWIKYSHKFFCLSAYGTSFNILLQSNYGK